MKGPERPTAPAPWSLEPGLESCDFCAHRFAIEVAYFCADCDRPVCPLCVMRVVSRGELLCPECAAQDAD